MEPWSQVPANPRPARPCYLGSYFFSVSGVFSLALVLLDIIEGEALLNYTDAYHR